MGDIEDLRKSIEQIKLCLIFFVQVSSIAQIIDRVWLVSNNSWRNQGNTNKFKDRCLCEWFTSTIEYLLIQ